MQIEKKSRILYIYKMLMEQTDTEHYLTVQQMISQLEEIGIEAFRKTVISDIEQLIAFGVDIICVKAHRTDTILTDTILIVGRLVCRS